MRMNKGIVAGLVAVVGVTAALAGYYIYDKKKKKKKYAETKCRNSSPKSKKEETVEEEEDTETESEFESKAEEILVKGCEFIIDHTDEIDAFLTIVSVIGSIVSLINLFREGKAVRDMNAKLDLLLRKEPPDKIVCRRILVRRFRPDA